MFDTSTLGFYFQRLLTYANDYLWNFFVPLAIPSVAILLLLGLRFAPLRYIGVAIRCAIASRKSRHTAAGEITSLRALLTSLGATVGSDSIVGVTVAIFVGGPGAVLWMWIAALLCMVVKYAEIVLAVHFRKINDEGVYIGGPIYYIRHGLYKHWHFLAVFFAIATLIAGVGIGGMKQSTLFTDSAQLVFAPLWVVADGVIGVILALVVCLILMGGIQRIAAWAARIAAFMIVFYLLIGGYFLVSHWHTIPSVFGLIFHHAFNESAAVGGFAGATVWLAIRMGVQHSLLSNDNGLGTVAMIHASAKTDNPAQQGLIGMLGSLIDTLLVCSITAFIILASGVWQTSSGLPDIGIATMAFESFLPGGQYFIAVIILLFSFSSLLGWSYYCESCFYALWGHYYVVLFRIAWFGIILAGAYVEFLDIFLLSHVANALMAIPNLFALVLLSPLVFYLSRHGLARLKYGQKT